MPKYLNVETSLGNAILWVTGLDVITGSTILGNITVDNIYWKLSIGILGVALLVARRVLQKFIDLNTPEKKE